MTRRFQVHLTAIAALLLASACETEDAAAKPVAAAGAVAEEAKPAPTAQDPDSAKVEDAAAKAEAEAAAKAEQAKALIPKLFDRTSETKTKGDLVALGTPAVEPLSEELKVQIVGFALGGSGSQAEAKAKLDHMHQANLLIEVLKEIGDPGTAAAKKVLDEIPKADQKEIADMFRARHQLFD